MRAHNAKNQTNPAPYGPKASTSREEELDVMLNVLADLMVDHLIDLTGRGGIDPQRGAEFASGEGVDMTESTRKHSMNHEGEDGA